MFVFISIFLLDCKLLEDKDYFVFTNHRANALYLAKMWIFKMSFIHTNILLEILFL